MLPREKRKSSGGKKRGGGGNNGGKRGAVGGARKDFQQKGGKLAYPLIQMTIISRKKKEGNIFRA